jgi:hypothetical protein
MSQENGPLKHIRAAALAAALVPLASVAATPAEAQTAGCGFSGGVCGFVWNDANNNGIQDDGDSAIPGAVVTLRWVVDGFANEATTSTNEQGFYYFGEANGTTDVTYTVLVQIPNNTEPSPFSVGDDEAIDSNGESDGAGNSTATVTPSGGDSTIDFGFHSTQTMAPGTGTPGYWMNHPEAWPVQQIVIGGVMYTKSRAIALLQAPGNKDKTYTMFSSLLSAKLNVQVGNNAECVSSTIAKADQWMADYGPVGNGVHASSYAWKVGEPFHRLMDNYNNGMLCAAHRD